MDETAYRFEQKKKDSVMSEGMTFKDLAAHLSGDPVPTVDMRTLVPGSITILFQHAFTTPEGIPPLYVTVYQPRAGFRLPGSLQLHPDDHPRPLSKIPIPRINVDPNKK